MIGNPGRPHKGTIGEASGARGWARAGRLVVLLDLLLVALLAGSVPVIGAGRPAARLAIDPIPLLGTVIDASRCVEAPLVVGKGSTVFCDDFSAITSPAGRVLVVSVHGPGHAVVDTFRGDLPEGLAWGDPLEDVLEALGRPYRISGAYGTPTVIYMFEDRPYGSLELRFNGADRLNGINACLTH